MTAYVVSGLGQAKAAGYTIEDDRLNKGRNWLPATLAAHPDMIPDLRAYTVYALATTGGAPKDALDKAWASRDKLSDEGLALAGLALDAAGDARAHQAAPCFSKKGQSDRRRMRTGRATTTGCWNIWDDTSPETTAFALKLLIRQDRASGLMPKAAQWLAEHRDGDYWYSTKQTAMVIQGLTDYLALSGELANSSDVEVLVNGSSVGKRHFGPGDGFRTAVADQGAGGAGGSGGQVTIRKSGNGITYWSAENSWYSADRKAFQQGKLALNITRDYYLLQKRQDKPTDPITYDLVPLNGPVHVGDIVAVRLALSGTDWKYLLAEDPIPAGTEFLPETGLYTLNNKPDWWADWFTRKEFHDDRAAFFNTEFSGRREYVYLLKVDNPGKFPSARRRPGRCTNRMCRPPPIPPRWRCSREVCCKDMLRRLRRAWGWVAAQFGGMLMLILAGAGMDALARQVRDGRWRSRCLRRWCWSPRCWRCRPEPCALWRTTKAGCGWCGARSRLLVWVAVGWAAWSLLDWCDDQIPKWAGYLNSRASAHWRARVFTYAHMQHWLTIAEWILRWIVVPGKVIPCAMASAQWGWRLPWRRLIRLLFNWRWWLAVVIAASLWRLRGRGHSSTALPHGTVSHQVWAVVFKLAAAYLLAVAVGWCCLPGRRRCFRPVLARFLRLKMTRAASLCPRLLVGTAAGKQERIGSTTAAREQQRLRGNA